MPVNTYFSHNRPNTESNVYEDLVIESIKIYGQDVYYIPRDIIEEDTLLNEVIESKFNDAYMIEMYLKNVDSFGGDGALLSKFGFSMKDQITLIVAKRRFDQLVSYPNNDITQTKPLEGDLIYLPFAKKLFEVRFIPKDTPFYQLNNIPSYELECELFTYEREKMSTGVPEIDSAMDSYDDVLRIEVSELTGEFEQEGCEITTPGGTTINAIITRREEVGGIITLTLSSISLPAGVPVGVTAGSSIVGTNSLAAGLVSRVIEMEDDDYTSNDMFANNDTFEKLKDDFIDFSVDNPFGTL